MTAPTQANNPLKQPVSGDLWMIVNAIKSGVYPWWYPDEAIAQGLAVDFYIYGSDYLPLPASSTLTQSINIDGSSSFYCVYTTLVETDTADTTFLAQRPILASILDTGSGTVLSNQPIHVDNWWGTAEDPFVWPVPKLFAPNATLQVTLQNLEATDRNVRLALVGFKIFNFTPTRR